LSQCQFKVTGWDIMFYLWHGTSVCWHIKTAQLKPGPVTADLTVIHSYK